MIHVLNMKTLENKWYDGCSSRKALMLANGILSNDERRVKFIVSQYTIELGDWATFKKAATAYIADHKRR